MLASTPGCVDPLQEEAVASLGGETPGIPEGPLHRAGQDCLVCHDGTRATELSIAGTIYRLAETEEPVAGALVHFMDLNGATHLAATNCAGNFFVRPGDFTPAYPMWVKIERSGYEQIMESPVNGDGSCAGCHASAARPSSAGRVYLLSFDIALPEEAGCP